MDRYARPSAHVLEQLKTIVGTEYVTNSKPILASYVSKGIMGLECTVADAVVRPRTVEEVREVLRVARKHKIPVTPSSGGLSGGFACPLTEPGGILLDLSRMDRILEVDADCRYMVVEPGVTSGAAWSYFRSNCPDLAPPVPDGAPPAATLLGDAIERGFNLATNKYGPQADLVLGMEVVLSTGQVVRTGSLALQGAKPFYKWGIGPDLGGLFLGAQGTMGIVTKLAIKVLRHPKHKDLIAYGFGTVEDMVRATFVVLKREICVLVQCGNWWLVPTRMAPEGEVSLERDFWRKTGVPEWFSNFEIWGEDEEDLDRQRRIIRTAMEQAKTEGIKSEEWKLHPRQKASRLTKPNDIAIPYALFRGSFLFITWYTPWTDAGRFCRIAEEKMIRYGFPPVLWVASIDNGRQAICMPIVCFDPTKPDELENVRDFNAETTDIFLSEGWLNYRPDPTTHSPKTFAKAKEYFDLLKKIKSVLDPDGIMHPGRLNLP